MGELETKMVKSTEFVANLHPFPCRTPTPPRRIRHKSALKIHRNLYLLPTSALVVVVGAAEAFVAPGLRVPQVAGTVPRAGVQAGVDL